MGKPLVESLVEAAVGERRICPFGEVARAVDGGAQASGIQPALSELSPNPCSRGKWKHRACECALKITCQVESLRGGTCIPVPSALSTQTWGSCRAEKVSTHVASVHQEKSHLSHHVHKASLNTVQVRTS